MIYYKATQPDGTDFRTGTINYGKAFETGETVTLPGTIRDEEDAAYYLSISTAVADCTGFAWPCRLFEVEPVGTAWAPHKNLLPNKRACVALRVVKERSAHEALGPQGAELVALFAAIRGASHERLQRAAARDAAWSAAWAAARGAAWGAARGAAWGAAQGAVWGAAQGAVWDAARDAARDAAWGLSVRDLIGAAGWTREHYNRLVGPWASVMGAVHPNDGVTFR